MKPSRNADEKCDNIFEHISDEYICDNYIVSYAGDIWSANEIQKFMDAREHLYNDDKLITKSQFILLLFLAFTAATVACTIIAVFFKEIPGYGDEFVFAKWWFREFYNANPAFTAVWAAFALLTIFFLLLYEFKKTPTRSTYSSKCKEYICKIFDIPQNSLFFSTYINEDKENSCFDETFAVAYPYNDRLFVTDGNVLFSFDESDFVICKEVSEYVKIRSDYIENSGFYVMNRYCVLGIKGGYGMLISTMTYAKLTRFISLPPIEHDIY